MSSTEFSSFKGFFAKIRSVQALVPTEKVAEYSEESLEQEVLEFYDSDQDEVEEKNSYYTCEDIDPTPVQSVKDEPLEEQEIKAMLGYFIRYSEDLLGFLYNPILTKISWNSMITYLFSSLWNS